MSRALSAPTAAAVATTFTQPRHLIEIDFAFTYRFSDGGDVTWNAVNWQQMDVKVSALTEKPDGSATLALAIGNTDRSFGSACFNEPGGPVDKAVSVWAYYGSALAAGDPVQIFSGTIDSWGVTEQSVTLQCAQATSSTLFIPRRRITRAAGFNHMTPALRVIEFGGVRYEIMRTP